MAISVSALTNGTSNSVTDATSYATGSISTAPSNTLLLARILTSFNGTTINSHTCSGMGLTWAQVNTSTIIVTQAKRLTVFRAVGTPSTGAVTFDCGGQTQGSAAWAVYRVDDTPIGSNGGAAIIQNQLATETANPTVSLSAFADASNHATLYFGYAYNNTLPTIDGSLTVLTSGNQSGINMGWIDAWLLGEDTSPSCTISTGNGNAIGLEIARATAGSASGAAVYYYGNLVR